MFLLYSIVWPLFIHDKYFIRTDTHTHTHIVLKSMKKCTHKQTHPTYVLSRFCKFFVGVEKHYKYNIIPPWILSCTCTTRCKCLTKLRSDIVYIQGDAYEQNGSLIPTPDLTIQIIEFTFMHDRFLDQFLQTKEDKYNLLVDAIGAQGWNTYSS